MFGHIQFLEGLAYPIKLNFMLLVMHSNQW